MDEVLKMARGGGAPSPAPAQEAETEMIASGVSHGGALHVFWVGEDKVTVWYRYQRKNETDWNDGGVLTKAPKKIAGLSSTLSVAGNLELFARYENGDVAHTWQKANESAWHGGEAGKQKASFVPLPK